MNNLWPTNVLLGKIDNRELYERVTTEILSLSLIQSDTNNIFNLGNEVFNEFKEKIVYPAFKEYITNVHNVDMDRYNHIEYNGWVTGGTGYVMNLHNHAGSQFSAVFYLMNEVTTEGGQIEFIDPRSNANRGYDQVLRRPFKNIEYMPNTGDYLIFPSFLYHGVYPFRSTLRMAIPVDLFLNEYE